MVPSDSHWLPSVTVSNRAEFSESEPSGLEARRGSLLPASVGHLTSPPRTPYATTQALPAEDTSSHSAGLSLGPDSPRLTPQPHR